MNLVLRAEQPGNNPTLYVEHVRGDYYRARRETGDSWGYSAKSLRWLYEAADTTALVARSKSPFADGGEC